jgi:hypothetical protein
MCEKVDFYIDELDLCFFLSFLFVLLLFGVADYSIIAWGSVCWMEK